MSTPAQRKNTVTVFNRHMRPLAFGTSNEVLDWLMLPGNKHEWPFMRVGNKDSGVVVSVKTFIERKQYEVILEMLSVTAAAHAKCLQNRDIVAADKVLMEAAAKLMHLFKK